MFQHLARFIKGSFYGFTFQYPWRLRCSSWWRLVFWGILKRLGIGPGLHDLLAARSIEPDVDVTLDDAAGELGYQISRVLNGGQMTKPSPTGEKLTHEQWCECHLCDAELHLSFLQINKECT